MSSGGTSATGTSVTGADLAGGELAYIAAQLRRAAGPEDVFGELPGAQAEQLAQLRAQYRHLALAVHPDRHRNDPLANQAFVALQRLYDTAEEQLQQGQYGQPSATAGAMVITTRRRSYTVGATLAEGDLANLYTCLVEDRQQQGATRGQRRGGILKVARDSQDNDLLLNEARALRHLLTPTNGEPAPAYIPRLLESFLYEDGSGVQRQVNAFPLIETERGSLPADDLYSLEEVRREYTQGVDPKQMAWMWRRLLIALGHAHDREVIHGSVLPSHILIHPAEHGLLLVDWCASVQQPSRTGTQIAFVSAPYERWYPLSVLAKHTPTPAVDLEMALRCMVHLLGGDPQTAALPPRVPGPLQAYLQGALVVAAHTAAWQLYQQFSDLMLDLWGKRTFVPFAMPARRPRHA
jgi:curved DNA-binding protein CbpA